MNEPAIQFPVVCPECALESPFQLAIAVVAQALLTGKSIRLHASCHDQYWTATFIEREQLRRILSTMNIEAPHRASMINSPPERKVESAGASP